MNFKDDKKPKTNIAMKLGTLIDVEGIKSRGEGGVIGENLQ
jgi:hypothetical protein